MPDKTGASVRRRRIAGERARKKEDRSLVPRRSAPARPRPGRESADRQSTSDGSSAWQPGRRTYAWFVLLCVVALVAAGVAGWWGYRDYRDGRIEDAQSDAVAPAGQAAEALLSFRHDSLDSELESEAGLMTDSYAEKFRNIFPEQAKQITSNAQATVESTVLAAGPRSCGDDCSADRAEILVYLDTESTVEGGAPEAKPNRAILVMERENEAWRVAEIELF